MPAFAEVLCPGPPEMGFSIRWSSMKCKYFAYFLLFPAILFVLLPVPEKVRSFREKTQGYHSVP